MAQAQEQTMEDILASIRRIISDDEDRNPSPKGNPAPNPFPGLRAGTKVSPLFADEQRREASPERSRPLAVKSPPPANDAWREDPLTSVAGQLDTTRVFHSDRAVPPAAGDAAERWAKRPLLSPVADAAVKTSFDDLSTALAANPLALDDLAEEMLRPMLRNWLDINLPPLVERLVREEIERIARGRR
jgi:cell pole-organizing protein PopZ